MHPHCTKYPYIYGYFAANFPYLTETVMRRNNKLQSHIAMLELHYFVDLPIQTYTEPVPLEYGKLATKYPWKYGYFLQCTLIKAYLFRTITTYFYV